jgi:MFS family permease
VRRRLPEPLRLREFALLWSVILTARFASAMVDVAVGWQVYAIHKRPLDLGLVGLAEFVPLPLLALPAGQLSDRFPRRRIAVVAGSVNAAIVAALLVVTIRGAHALWPFLALAAASGIATVTGSPALNALTPEIVPVELLPGAVALRSVAGQTAVVSGPAIGGLLFAVSPKLTYSVALGLFVVAVTAAFSLERRPAVSTARAPGFGDLIAGVRFIKRTRILLGAIGLDLFAVLFGGAVALLPVYARTILDVGPVGLGVLRTAPAVGALVAAVILARRPLRYAAGPTLLVVVAAFGAAIVVFGLSKSFPLSIVALAVSGFVDMISVNIRSTTAALVTPNELRGRVLAVEWVFISASNELGAFESGAAAALLGTVRAVVIGGVATIGIAAAWTRLFPSLARMGRLQDLRPEPA